MDSPTPIGLPRGGGALSGIGEKFAADPHTGTGNFTIPLALPPGRNGLAPALRLDYSTGTGNGPFGLGWALSVSGVSRKTAKGVPRYDEERDVFLLSGAEDLVPVDVSGAVTRYRPRTEGPYARILRELGQGDSHWQVTGREGLVTTYGTPGAGAADTATVADPADRGRVFAWRITRTEDPFGNHVAYDHLRDTGADGRHRWDQLYLRRVRYVDHGDGPQYLVSVIFEYAVRPDPFSDRRAGFEIRTRLRCTRVVVQTHAGADRVVRSYDLTYRDQLGPDAGPEPLNGVSLLSQVVVTGHDGERSESMPALEFRYSAFDPARRAFRTVRGPDLPSGSLADPRLALVDLDGNGMPDLVEIDEDARHWRNLGDGHFDLPRRLPESLAGIRLAEAGVRILDADGDGRADLMVSRGTLSGYLPLRSHRDADVLAVASRRDPFRRFGKAPTFDITDPEVHFVDLDGDGVTDAVRSGSRLECFFHDPGQGWNRTRAVARKSLDAFPDVSFTDPRIRFADLTGDGLQDIVLIHDGSVEYWPSLGHGDWGPRVITRNAPRFPVGYDPRRLLLGDVDGDGLADLVHVGEDTVTLWINRGGWVWSDPVVIRARAGDPDHRVRGTPPPHGGDLRLVDLLGNGIDGVLWSHDVHGWSFLDLTGGKKPYLLEEIDNHIGATTRVGYAPSTWFYAEDERHREARWRTSLPFPVHVVDTVRVRDHFSGGTLTTRYRYRHGHWDGAEREFRGFGRVEQTDAEVLDAAGEGAVPNAPPVLHRTWFHLGPVGPASGEWVDPDFSGEYWTGQPATWPAPELPPDGPSPDARLARRDAVRALRGSVLRSEVYVLDRSGREGRPHTVAETAYAVAEVEPPVRGRERVHFPHAIASRSTQWERGDDPMNQFTFTRYRDAAGQFDPYGRIRALVSVACPRGWRTMDDRPAAPHLATTTRTDYAVPDAPAVHIHDRVAATTIFEITDTAGKTLSEVAAANGRALRLDGQTVHHYDGPAFVGLTRGRVGSHGLAVRSESLVLTDDVLEAAYGAQMRTYLGSDAPVWDPAYPASFRGLLAPRAGYAYRTAGDDPGSEPGGWFATGDRRRFDGRGLLLEIRDGLWHAGGSGHATELGYDAYALLAVWVRDSAGLVTTAAYDYRVFQPVLITDPNGAQSRFAYSPAGLLSSVTLRGATPGEGDQANPSTRFEYDFGAYDRSPPAARQPIRVRTIRRRHRDTDLDVPSAARDETIGAVEHSDGFGRLLQTRVQGDDVRFGDPAFGGGDLTGVVAGQDDPHVTVSGWQVYDNKGRVVEDYEPYFSRGWDYDAPAEAAFGRKIVTVYDPLGRPLRTIRPDGAEDLVVRGVPAVLDRPNEYAPTPWETYTYDVADNAGRTHPDDLTVRHHRDTPASARVDPLGRVVEAVARLRDPSAADGDPLTELTTTTTYDIRGNQLKVVDPSGRDAFQQVYDLANHVLRADSADAGVRLTVVDALGRPVESRDGRGAVVLRGYDGLNRPIRIWARESADAPITLVERIEYGDGGAADQDPATRADARSAYRLGRLHRHWDGAGESSADRYEFTGSLVEKSRRVVADAALLGERPYRPDWERPAATPFEPGGYTTTTRYDALGRIIRAVLPADVDGVRRALVPRYNRAGALAGLASEVPGVPGAHVHVERIAHDAKGRRILVAYGNGIMTRYAYDQETLRLVRMRSERFTQPAVATYRPAGQVEQEFAYRYDLVGNITTIVDRTPSCGVPGTPLGLDALDRTFAYDSLYRLLRATGRECDKPPVAPWDAGPRSVDPTRTRAYTESYRFDPLGGLAELKHLSGGAGQTRTFAVSAASNRLDSMTVGPVTTAYTYDANGNLISDGTSRHFAWDHVNRLRSYRNQAGGGPASVSAQYLYDAGGQRVKKVVRAGAKVTVIVYVDGLLERTRVSGVGSPVENDTIHVMDDRSRIATIRVGPALPGDATPAVTFHLGDHLGSASLVLDGAGAPVSREEYTPYGETGFGGHAFKRYRYSGKERDEESGLSYFGFRYYVPWLARWASPDPSGAADGPDLYRAFAGNPMRMRDSAGLQSNDFHEGPAMPSESGNSTMEGSAASSAGGTVAAGPGPPDEAANGEPFGPPRPSAEPGPPAAPAPAPVAPPPSRSKPRSSLPGPGDLLAAIAAIINPDAVAPHIQPRGAETGNPGVDAMVNLTANGAKGAAYLHSDMTAVGAGGVAAGLTAGVAGPAVLAATELPPGALAAKGGAVVGVGGIATHLYVRAGIYATEVTVGGTTVGVATTNNRLLSTGTSLAPTYGNQAARLAANPTVAKTLKDPLSDNYLNLAFRHPNLARAVFGKVWERLCIQNTPNLVNSLGGAGQPDAEVRIGSQLVKFEWTTWLQFAKHLDRQYYLRGPWLVFLNEGPQPGWP